MNTYRNGDSMPVPPENDHLPENDQPPQNEPLLQSILQSIPPPQQSPPMGVTYAQILRHNALNNNNNNSNQGLDFSLQTPRSDNDNGSVISDYRSVSSNGYVNVNFNPQVNMQQNVTQRNRPQSPETSF